MDRNYRKQNNSIWNRNGDHAKGKQQVVEERCLLEDGEIMIQIPKEWLQDAIPRIFQNKIVIAFDGSCTKLQAQKWIETYNSKELTQLVYVDSLVNDLFFRLTRV